MMETAEFRHRPNPSAVMNGPPKWRVFVQPEVGAPGVVVIHVGAKQPTQMRFTHHDHMVQQVPTDRSNDTFDGAVRLMRTSLQGARSWGHQAAS